MSSEVMSSEAAATAERLSRADPALFRLLADCVRDYAIFLLDPTGHVISWNLGAHLIKQYSESEILGQHFSIFYTAEDKARNWPGHELSHAFSEGRFEDNGWRVRKDGTRFWANVIITALRGNDGELLAYSKITRDLTKRKFEEELLRRSEERFRLLVDGVQDYAIFLLEPSGTVTSWNGGAYRIKGYQSAEILGQHFSRFYTAEDLAEGRPAAALARAREQGSTQEEGWRVRKDGSRFWARVIITALYDLTDTFYGYAKVTQDLTQRRHAEALESATKNIHEFMAVLAHELRNPLAPIRNGVYVLKMAGETDPMRRNVLDIIDRQSGQLMRIVDDLLDISRITRGTLAITKLRTPVSDIVTRAVEAAQPAVDAAGHSLAIDLADAPLYIDGDEVRIAQVLTNILNNAVRYTEPGGNIWLKVTAEQYRGSNQVVIRVRDNGRGIAPELLGPIFSMFVQGQDLLNKADSGLGVGLALARSLVELHHGTLEVESEGLGHGSEFTIRLPMVEAPPEADAEAAEAV